MTLSRTSSRTPLSAAARSAAATSRSTSCMERSSTTTMSSKTNICERTRSARSGSVLASDSRIDFSVGREARLMISTSVSTPPAEDSSALASREPMRRLISSSTRRTTSGEVRSIMAIRSATSACRSGDSRLISSAAWGAGRWASTSATICGCSSRRKDSSCRVSALRSPANGGST